MVKIIKRGVMKMSNYLVKNYSSGSILERAVYSKQITTKLRYKRSIIETKLFNQSAVNKIMKDIVKCIKSLVK